MYKTYSTAIADSSPPDTLREYILSTARRENNFRDSIDLFPFFSLLVSSGWNKNKDVFDAKHILKAKHTPENKPLNWMHIQSDIVGHIVHNVVVDANLNPLPDDMSEDDIPDKIHIVTANVLYSIWEDKKQQLKVNSIIQKINAGQLFVSMECLFKDFDYALANDLGEQKLIARNSQTNYLTKFLRQYNGPGRVGNYVIGRLLKDITFSAVGLVDNPANEASIISDNLDLFRKSFANLGYITLDQLNGELTMADTVKSDVGEIYATIEDHPTYKGLISKHGMLEKDCAELKQKLEESTMAKETEEKDKMCKENADLKQAVAKAEKDKDDAEAALAGKEDFWKKEKEKDDKEKAALAAENEALKKTKKEYEDAAKSTARTEALMKVDTKLTKEKASEMVSKAGEMSDSAFDTMVSMVTSYASKKEVTAAEVIEKSKAEEGADATLGSSTVNPSEVVRAQVLEWSGVKTRKGEK